MTPAVALTTRCHHTREEIVAKQVIVYTQAG